MARAERSGALAAELARHRRLSQAGAALSVLAALVWPAQAAVIAALTGERGLAPVPTALILIKLAGVRAGADAASLARAEDRYELCLPAHEPDSQAPPRQ